LDHTINQRVARVGRFRRRVLAWQEVRTISIDVYARHIRNQRADRSGLAGQRHASGARGNQ
jgi:hypothetical protein